MLESRTQHHARIFVKDIFSAVAMVHVEIGNRHAIQAMRGQRVRRTDGDVIEDTESHRPRSFRMMSGRADIAEGILHFASHHQVHAHHRRTCGAQRGRIGKGIHAGVAIEFHPALFRRGSGDSVHIVRIMHAQ